MIPAYFVFDLTWINNFDDFAWMDRCFRYFCSFYKFEKIKRVKIRLRRRISSLYFLMKFLRNEIIELNGKFLNLESFLHAFLSKKSVKLIQNNANNFSFCNVGTQEERRPHSVPRQETLLWWIQVHKMQTQVDVWKFMGKHGTGMHQVPDQSLSPQTGKRSHRFEYSWQNFYLQFFSVSFLIMNEKKIREENKRMFKKIPQSNLNVWFFSFCSGLSKSQMVWMCRINQSCIHRCCAKSVNILVIIAVKICERWIRTR